MLTINFAKNLLYKFFSNLVQLKQFLSVKIFSKVNARYVFKLITQIENQRLNKQRNTKDYSELY